MLTGVESSHKKKDKSEPSSDSDTPKKDKNQETDDPKPRIVLTFRSDKSGAKSSNMKIVSTEEKHEDIAPRRSNRPRKSNWESDDDVSILVSPVKDKGESQPLSENDEASDSIHTAKRSKRRCNKVSTELTSNLIARKEKLSKESTVTTPRLFRRIKPTPKFLANEELRIGLESQNNLRLGIAPEKSNSEGVQTRRSAHSKSADSQFESTVTKLKSPDEGEGSDSKSISVKKLQHLCELGLKSIEQEKSDDDSASDHRGPGNKSEDRGEEDEEIDDDTEVISKLLQADEESGTSGSEAESIGSEEMDQIKPKQPRKLVSSNESEGSSQEQDEEPKTPPRRSRRLKNPSSKSIDYMLGKWKEDSGDTSDFEYKPKTKKRRSLSEKIGNFISNTDDEQEINAPADADEGSAPASPAESNKIVGQCCCEDASNIYAAPSELAEPVFCQAVETVEDMRVGCSHPAARAGKGGALLAMIRAGPRAPYLLACRLHAAQMARHMCCPICGLFCTHGEFYQCSSGHLFHLECSLPRQLSDGKTRGGCPHCGVWSYRWAPANTECRRVRVEMRSSNRRVYLPDQREQCTPAFLGFSQLDPTKLDRGPLIPEDLLPPLPVDIKKLCESSHIAEDDDSAVLRLHEAILAGETMEQIIPKIVGGARLNECVRADDAGVADTCAHAAAMCARVDVLYALQCAGASLDAPDRTTRTPLMRAILCLLEKETVEEPEDTEEPLSAIKEKIKEEKCGDKEESGDKQDDIKEEKEKGVGKDEGEDKDKTGEQEKSKDQDLIKVIRFLVAAGCDVNITGPEAMTALHVAAAHGGAEACALLLGAGAHVDAPDQGGWTPLVRAAENGHAHIVRLLLEAGADAGITDNEGHGALHWCALAGRARCLRLLLAAAPHAASLPNAHTDTPLHVAAREGHYECVVILLAHGARTDIENSAGELPVEVCEGRCQTAISLNMQMSLAIHGNLSRHRLLSSDISNGRELHPVPCINEVDDAPLPTDFTYVAQLVLPAPLHVDYTLATLQGCSCTEGDCSDGACACCTLGVRSWYVRGRLPPQFPYHDPPMLFECNHTCACNMKRCGNRVVSRVQAVGSLGAKVQVFRTARRGWGLRTRTPLRRGAVAAIYCGELLARREADARPTDHYMFELDLKRDLLQQCSGEVGEDADADVGALCVDAARWGGAARFINHSCRPNLAPVRVFTSSRDLRLPAVALFATSDVPAYRELTFDYGDKFWSVKSKWMRCECEAPDCRYPNKDEEE